MILERFSKYFKITEEKEDFEVAFNAIERAIYFRGTNLWILIFAIIIASLGLNVNSTAVIIGAMLISPIMGPIIGIGLSVAINDLELLRKAFINLSMAVLVGLTASTIYFVLSPLNQAHSELLSRTSPTIYDVLIALFGGFAGTVAIFSKNKGNVIPGAAIATALMPPLCTAGFGLATGKWNFFFGAFYLFIINAVFIAAATLIATRLLKFPYKHLPDQKAELRVKRIIALIVFITLVPSVYFGYDLVQQDKFNRNASSFIEKEAIFPNDYLLSKKIEPKERKIILTYGGDAITDEAIKGLKSKLHYYNLEQSSLEIRQGFTYLNDAESTHQAEVDPLRKALLANEDERKRMQRIIDSLNNSSLVTNQLITEAKALCPELTKISITPLHSVTNTAGSGEQLVYLVCFKTLNSKDKQRLKNWLEIKLHKKIQLLVAK